MATFFHPITLIGPSGETETLEAFLLTVDPVEGRLVPKQAYLMGNSV